MNRRDLVVFIAPYELKVMLISETLRVHYAVSEHFDACNGSIAEEAIFTDLVENIEEDINSQLLDETGSIIVGDKESIGVSNIHLVLSPEYFLSSFVVALSEFSRTEIDKLLFSLPVRCLYSSHLMHENVEQMIESFNTILPDITILAGGEVNSHAPGVITLADFFSLTHSKKDENRLLFIGTPLEKDEVFKRLNPMFSTFHYPLIPKKRRSIFKNIRKDIQELLIVKLQKMMPQFEPLFEIKKPHFISDVIQQSAWLFAQFYSENTLVAYYASSFVIYASCWKEGGEWLSDARIVAYRSFPSMQEAGVVESLVRENVEQLITIANKSIDAIFLGNFSIKSQFDRADDYVYSDERREIGDEYVCSKFVYGGELVGALKNDADIFGALRGIRMLDSFTQIYSDVDYRLFAFATMSIGDSQQAQVAIEQDVAPPTSLHGCFLTSESLVFSSKLMVTLFISGGDLGETKTKQLSVGYRYPFLLQLGQRAKIVVSGGLLGGKKEHNFVCDKKPFYIFIDLRTSL